MKKITQYQTTDGQTFTNKQEAKLHDAGLEFDLTIKLEQEPTFTAAPDCLRMLAVMKNDPEFFIDALQIYAKVKNRITAKMPVQVA